MITIGSIEGDSSDSSDSSNGGNGKNGKNDKNDYKKDNDDGDDDKKDYAFQISQMEVHLEIPSQLMGPYLLVRKILRGTMAKTLT